MHLRPTLPWEVIERVIGHAYDDLDLLRSFSLTCRQLRPRSLWFMIKLAHLKNRNHVAAFCDFLGTDTGSQLKPYIQSLTISPTSDVPHVPLLKTLPNLSRLVLIPPRSEYYEKTGRPAVYLHTPTLFCYRQYGKGIQRLEFAHVSFSTFPDFCRFLGAFPNMLHFICRNVQIQKEATDVQHAFVRSLLSKAVQPKKIAVRVTSQLPPFPLN